MNRKLAIKNMQIQILFTEQYIIILVKIPGRKRSTYLLKKLKISFQTLLQFFVMTEIHRRSATKLKSFLMRKYGILILNNNEQKYFKFFFQDIQTMSLSAIKTCKHQPHSRISENLIDSSTIHKSCCSKRF